MLLPNSFAVFVQSTTARPYLPQVKGITDNTEYTDSFGLGGVYNQDTDELRITVGQRLPGLDFTTVVSGTLGVYRVCDSGADVLLQEVELDPEYLKKPKNQIYWEIILRPDVDYSELMLACTLSSASTSISTWTPVDYEARTKEVSYFTERFRTSLDVLTEHQPYTMVVTDLTDTTILDLDLRNSAPVITGDGTLAYSGGGNRYLLDSEYNGVKQLVNQEPWGLDCTCFIETQAKNYLADPELMTQSYAVTTSSAMSTVKKTLELPAFADYQALTYSVSSPLDMDSTWEWSTLPSTCVNATLTGSLYFEYTSTSNLIVEVGLRITDTTTRETISVLNTSELKSLALVAVTDPVSIPSNDPRTVVLFVRVRNISPGDRFECVMAMPQIENTATSTSRIIGQQTRSADTLTWTPTVSDYNDAYGTFTCSVYPAWEGNPKGLGDQYLFDTRDVNGEAGFWCAVLANGVLEFGVCPDILSEQYVVRSASPIPAVFNSVLKIQASFDNNTLVLMCNDSVVGRQVFITSILAPDILSIRIGRHYSNTHVFNGEYQAFNLSSTPIEGI